MAKILYIEDDLVWQDSMTYVLETANHTIVSAKSHMDAKIIIDDAEIDVLVFDLFLGGKQNPDQPLIYIDAFVDGLKSQNKIVPPIIIVSGFPIPQPQIIKAFTEYRGIIYDFFQKASFGYEKHRFLHSIRAAEVFINEQRMSNNGLQNNGQHVFIGHGRSSIWRSLKDFLFDDCSLPWDEFDRVSAVGILSVDRIIQMLNNAGFAFLIMTAEDEQMDGKLHARMNVIHEIGLFQGRLGLKKAVVLLEDGCEPFSNIHGLGQIHFPKGNIETTFERIRRVLKREGLL